MPLNDRLPWATIMLGILVGIAAIAGAVVVIVHGESLSFEKYLDLLKNFAIAVGILGVGRGIVAHGTATAQASTLNDSSLLDTGPQTDEWRPAAAGGDVPSYDMPGDVPDYGYDETSALPPGGNTIEG
jgi:hypothetical protein